MKKVKNKTKAKQILYMYNVLQSRHGRLRETRTGEAVTSRSPLALFLLFLLLFFLATGRCQVKEERLVVVLLLPLLPSGLRLSFIVQQQVRVIVPPTVGHHHRANGAGVDVLDLEKALDHIDVLRFDILLQERNIYFVFFPWKPTAAHAHIYS